VLSIFHPNTRLCLVFLNGPSQVSRPVVVVLVLVQVVEKAAAVAWLLAVAQQNIPDILASDGTGPRI